MEKICKNCKWLGVEKQNNDRCYYCQSQEPKYHNFEYKQNIEPYPDPPYQDLFNYLIDECDFTALQSNLHDITDIVLNKEKQQIIESNESKQYWLAKFINQCKGDFLKNKINLIDLNTIVQYLLTLRI